MRVAIVGAGINGLYLAWKLSEEGHEVTLFEKKERIGKEVCSGLFSERILDFIPQSQKLIKNQIDYCLIHFPQKTIKINFQKHFLLMSHFELDNLVANLSKRAGAKILLNHNLEVSDIAKLDFQRIIGCDGIFSVVRKYLNLAEPKFRLGMQGLYSSYKLEDKNYVETWPSKNGFIWKIPRREKTEYGIIEEQKRAKSLFGQFLKKEGLQLDNLKSALIPQGLIIPCSTKITLCGDAAGLTKPWSGGGVVWGLLAAQLLLKNFPDFIKYRKAVKKFFLPKIIFSKVATKIVYFFGFNFPWLFPKNITIEGDFLL